MWTRRRRNVVHRQYSTLVARPYVCMSIMVSLLFPLPACCTQSVRHVAADSQGAKEPKQTNGACALCSSRLKAGSDRARRVRAGGRRVVDCVRWWWLWWSQRKAASRRRTSPVEDESAKPEPLSRKNNFSCINSSMSLYMYVPVVSLICPVSRSVLRTAYRLALDNHHTVTMVSGC